MKMKIVVLDEHIVDRMIELVEDYRKDVATGSTVVDQPVADELSDMDLALAALRNTEDASYYGLGGGKAFFTTPAQILNRALDHPHDHGDYSDVN